VNEAADAAGAASPEHRVAQRLTIVLPSDGRFDSRAWKVAASLTARGHAVTVLARSGNDLPDRERHPSGYVVIRVPVSAAGGLPAVLRPLARLRRRERPTADGRSSSAVAAAAGGRERRSAVAWARSGIAAIIRLGAIALTVRSQRLASHQVAPNADLIHAMAYMGISTGLDLGQRDKAPVIYDARDIYVQARNIARLPGPARRLFGWVERRWAQRANRVMTVNRPYAQILADSLHVPLPAIVMNCSLRRDAPADRARLFHERLGLDEKTRVALYPGGLAPDRGIEQLLAAAARLPADVHVCLLGYGPMEDDLVRRLGQPDLAARASLLPAVPPEMLLDWVASADVAVMPIQPSTLNHRLTTPNKLFEAMAVGVPVVASDLPGMATIVRETGCGVLCDPTDPGAIAAAIRAVVDAAPAARDAFRRGGLKAAATTYNWEAQLEVLLAEYGRLTGRPW
jgi:glycosyltransferase involved in cell wall biosynthesis